jgi:membrane protease YdiL (CAAX protease family)
LINSAITGKQQMLIQQPVYMLFVMIPVMIIGGGLEELGWRGVLLPELLKKYSILVSTIIVSITWVIWHIPLWFINGVYQYGSNFAEFAFPVIGISLLFSFVYVKTKSIFMCILFHSLSNSYMAIFSTPCLDTLSQIINISVKLIICIGIFIVFLALNKKSTYINMEVT